MGNYEELPQNSPMIYPEEITVNRIQVMGNNGVEAGVTFIFKGLLEKYSGQPFNEWLYGTIAVTVAPGVAEAMVPLIVRCVTWREGEPEPGGIMVMEWGEQDAQRRSDDARARSEGQGEGDADGPGEAWTGGDAGGDGPGMASTDVGGSGGEEVAPVPPEVELGICMHPANMVGFKDNEYGRTQIYCYGCDTVIEDYQGG